MYVLSLSVHDGASVFGTAGILGGGFVGISVACGQERPGHDSDHKGRVLQRYLRFPDKRSRRPVCWLNTTMFLTTPIGTSANLNKTHEIQMVFNDSVFYKK